MKKIIVFTSIMLLSCLALSAREWIDKHPYIKPNTKLRPNKVVLLYPEGQASGKGIVENGVEITKGAQESNGILEEETMTEKGSIYKISEDARMAIYLPKKCKGQMVVICPGGSNIMVSSFNEGVYAAEWMVERGIAACVLYYRLPNGHHTVPLDDVQNAFRYCRYHAEEWGVKTIGVLGGSAGGHLAGTASTMYVDEVTRPDFSILIYPRLSFAKGDRCTTRINLIGKDADWDNKDKSIDEYNAAQQEQLRLIQHYIPENHIDANTPPAFITLSMDDTVVESDNYIGYYKKLRENNVMAQTLIFPVGGHGWGFSSERYAGKGNDRLGAYRKVFDLSLETWLAELRNQQ